MFSHPERWVFQTIGEYSEEDLYRLRGICSLYVGMGYAYKDVIKRFGFGKKVNDPNKYWCSEICIHVINRFLKQNTPTTLSPSQMFKVYE
jgi:hypothetical protein